MKYLTILALLASAAVCVGSEQADKEFKDAMDKAQAEFDTKVKVARDKYIVALKASLDGLTKAGKLDDAIKVRDKIAALEKQNADALKAAASPEKPAPEGMRAWVGAYVVTTNGQPRAFVCELQADGSAMYQNRLCKWKMTGTNVEITDLTPTTQTQNGVVTSSVYWVYTFKPTNGTLVFYQFNHKDFAEGTVLTKKDDGQAHDDKK